MRKAIIAVAALLILGGVNFAIYKKEALLRDGQVVLLELAPVDPRSFMQGDYMALRYRLAEEFFYPTDKEPPADGRVVLALDANQVAGFRRFDDGTPLATGEVKLRYRIRHGVAKFATNGFFFQEGLADQYADARFGEFRVADNGECILTGMRDAHFKRLGPEGG